MSLKFFKKNNIIILFLLFFLFSSINVFANNCKYSSKLNQCREALNSFYDGELRKMIPGSRLKSFGDFPCIQDSIQKQYYQITMDELFSEIDDEMQDYLGSLYEDKNYYFGKEKKFDYIDGVNDIYKTRDYFLGKYYKACDLTYKEVINCFSETIIRNGANDFIRFSGGDCQSLSKRKTDIFLGVSYNGLLLNKQQILRDQKRFYDLKVKTKYDEVLDLFSINYSYIERLWKKWSVKIKHTLGVK